MARLSQHLRKMGSAALLASGVGAFHVDEAQRTVEVGPAGDQAVQGFLMPNQPSAYIEMTGTPVATPGEAKAAAKTQVKVASTIEFRANPGREQDAAAFLNTAKDLVVKTEPGTHLWYGVKFHAMKPLGQSEEKDRFGIVDFFVDDSARGAHFAGEVPKAVQKNDKTPSPIVKGGIAAIAAAAKDWNLIAAPKTTTKEQMESAKFLGYLPIRAGEGQEENMKALLTAGLGLVTEKEPKTSFWAAVQNQKDAREFAIIDTFDSMEGVGEHFMEPAVVPAAVKATLKENPKLIVGGWEGGVVPNVRIMEILAQKVALGAGSAGPAGAGASPASPPAASPASPPAASPAAAAEKPRASRASADKKSRDSSCGDSETESQ